MKKVSSITTMFHVVLLAIVALVGVAELPLDASGWPAESALWTWCFSVSAEKAEELIITAAAAILPDVHWTSVRHRLIGETVATIQRDACGHSPWRSTHLQGVSPTAVIIKTQDVGFPRENPFGLFPGNPTPMDDSTALAALIFPLATILLLRGGRRLQAKLPGESPSARVPRLCRPGLPYDCRPVPAIEVVVNRSIKK